MKATIAILCPVLNRAHRVVPLVESVRAASRVTPCETVFLCSPGDDAEIEACRAVETDDVTVTVVPFENGPGDWSRKINYGFAHTETPFVFTGADDLRFRPGWAERAIATYLETGACVVGHNDLGHGGTATGEHSTHFFVCREYGECGTIDEPDSGKIVPECYGHWFPDAEAIAVAKARRTYAHAADCIIEHEHPNWGKAVMDDTYRRGQATIAQDRALFELRRRLWT